MNLKDLDYAQRVYLEIKELDSEIAKLERKAIEISESSLEASLDLKFKETEVETEEPVSYVGNDHVDFSAIFKRIREAHFSSADYSKKYSDSIEFPEMDQSVSLRIIGVLLEAKMSYREKLLKSLTKIGVEL